jgi:hypothetical protein
MAGAEALLSERRSNADPGTLVSAPGASLNPVPGSGDRRRNVTSSGSQNPAPRRAPPPVDVPNRTTTSVCSSIDSTTNRNSVKRSNRARE